MILTLNPFRTPEQTEQLTAAAIALSAYMHELMDRRRAAPEDDLISDMMLLQKDGAPLGDGDISVNLQSLLVGGNLTTTDLIGNGIWLFLNHPQELAKLKAEPALINSAVEEILRYESPIDITGRIASRDIEVQGCPVKQTQSMFMSLRGANRDPETFPRAAPLRYRPQGRAACVVRRRLAPVHRRPAGKAGSAGGAADILQTASPTCAWPIRTGNRNGAACPSSAG